VAKSSSLDIVHLHATSVLISGFVFVFNGLRQSSSHFVFASGKSWMSLSSSSVMISGILHLRRLQRSAAASLNGFDDLRRLQASSVFNFDVFWTASTALDNIQQASSSTPSSIKRLQRSSMVSGELRLELRQSSMISVKLHLQFVGDLRLRLHLR
jgi:hypothetical protein